MSDRFTLLIVDDEPLNLGLLKQILQDEYHLLFARDGEKALQLVHSEKPDLILLDVMMPGMDGHEVCQKLKADPAVHHIPVIFVTAMTDAHDEEKGLQLGAVDYLTKPVNSSIVHIRIKTHLALSNQRKSTEKLVQTRTAELLNSQRASVHMLGKAGHYNDTDTGVHIWRMAAYAGALARAVGWTVEDSERLELAAPMHDTGKIGIPDSILKAPRPLEKDEWVKMKQHTTIGHQILSSYDCPLFNLAAEIALCHHEKWDGSGYPQGLSADKIPESALISAIADVFDALTMKRPYKEPWTTEKAIETIKKDSGQHFAPYLIEAFIEILPDILHIKESWDKTEQHQAESETEDTA